MTGNGRVPDVTGRRAVVVVDAANVVGSRPDGWWRDRPGAAARLRDDIVGARLPEEVVLVLEGAARTGVPAGDPAAAVAGVTVVHARGEGDDAIVAQARLARADGAAVTVVTADRGLRSRLPAEVAVVGPATFRRRLPG